MVTKIDNYGLQNMDRDILGACGDDAGGIKSHYGIRDGFSLWSASSCAAGRENAGSSTYRAVSGVKLASNIACLITVPCSCVFGASSRPSSEKAGVNPKTQAERPRYKITGTATFTGRFSSAVGTTREALKEALPHIQKSEFSSGIISPGNTSFSTCSTPEKGLASLV